MISEGFPITYDDESKGYCYDIRFVKCDETRKDICDRDLWVSDDHDLLQSYRDTPIEDSYKDERRLLSEADDDSRMLSAESC